MTARRTADDADERGYGRNGMWQLPKPAGRGIHFGFKCVYASMSSNNFIIPSSLSAYIRVISGLIIPAATVASPSEIAVSQGARQGQMAGTADDADERGYDGMHGSGWQKPQRGAASVSVRNVMMRRAAEALRDMPFTICRVWSTILFHARS